MDIEEDAVAERSFHARLVQIDADMHQEDINAIKFLCKDRVAKSKLAGTKSALDIFTILESSRLMSSRDPWILVEIFTTIGRLDLVDLLDVDETRLKTFKTSGKISKYRHLLFDVAQDMTAEDTKKLCFLCEKIPRGRRERVVSAVDLFGLLEESKLLSSSQLSFLLQHLTHLNRLDLVHRIQALHKDGGSTDEGQGGLPERQQGDEASLPIGSTNSGVQSQKEASLPIGSTNSGVQSQKEASLHAEKANGIPESIRLSLGKELCKFSDAELCSFWEGLGYKKEWMERLSSLGCGAHSVEEKREDLAYKMLECAPLLGPDTHTCLLKLINVSRLTGLLPLFRQLVAAFKGQLPDLPEEYLREVEAHSRSAQETSNMHVSTEEASEAIAGNEAGLRCEPETSGRLKPAADTGAGLKRSTETWTGLEQDKDHSILPHYKMDAKPRGICVIFNNQHFTSDGGPDSVQLKDRIGSQIDAGKLENTFKGLQFDVSVIMDSTVQEMLATLKRIAQEKVTAEQDCFVCCVLTHGKNDQIYGSHGYLLDIRKLMAPFRATSCPNLAGKPKLFFLQACQGSKTQQGMEVEADGPVKEVVPDEADFLLGYATAPGYVSFRSKSQGSWYISALTSHLDSHAYQYDLLSILTMVNNEVCKKGTTSIQSPAPQYTLRRRLLFKKLDNQ